MDTAPDSFDRPAQRDRSPAARVTRSVALQFRMSAGLLTGLSVSPMPFQFSFQFTDTGFGGGPSLLFTTGAGLSRVCAGFGRVCAGFGRVCAGFGSRLVPRLLRCARRALRRRSAGSSASPGPTTSVSRLPSTGPVPACYCAHEGGPVPSPVSRPAGMPPPPTGRRPGAHCDADRPRGQTASIRGIPKAA